MSRSDDIGNLFNRLVFAMSYGERNILFNGSINDNSKILFVRNPSDRVNQVAPWLTLDGDPYPAVVDGRVQWIVDGYTTLDSYPYAQQTSLGDATQDALRDIWNGERYQAFREALLSDQPPPACANCGLRWSL